MLVDFLYIHELAKTRTGNDDGNGGGGIHDVSSKKNRKLNLAWKLCTYSWIRRQQRADKKQFANKPERLRQFRDHQWKALGKENLDFLGSIFVVNF